jgi:hypothetical protein
MVAAWPALALLLTVELLSRSGRKIEKLEVATTTAPAEQVSTVQPVTVAAVTSPTLPQATPVSPAPYGPVRGHLRSRGRSSSRS